MPSYVTRPLASNDECYHNTPVCQRVFSQQANIATYVKRKKKRLAYIISIQLTKSKHVALSLIWGPVYSKHPSGKITVNQSLPRLSCNPVQLIEIWCNLRGAISLRSEV